MALKAIWLHVLCVFSTKQFSLFIQNVKICMAIILPEMAALLMSLCIRMAKY